MSQPDWQLYRYQDSQRDSYPLRSSFTYSFYTGPRHQRTSHTVPVTFDPSRDADITTRTCATGDWSFHYPRPTVEYLNKEFGRAQQNPLLRPGEDPYQSYPWLNLTANAHELAGKISDLEHYKFPAKPATYRLRVTGKQVDWAFTVEPPPHVKINVTATLITEDGMGHVQERSYSLPDRSYVNSSIKYNGQEISALRPDKAGFAQILAAFDLDDPMWTSAESPRMNRDVMSTVLDGVLSVHDLPRKPFMQHIFDGTKSMATIRCEPIEIWPFPAWF